MFLAVIAISMGLQALFVEVGGEFFKTTGLTGAHWGITVGLGALTLVVGVLLRFVPVPARETDFASFFSEWFAEKEAKKASGATQADTALTVRTP
jgi:hypothetical protein